MSPIAEERRVRRGRALVYAALALVCGGGAYAVGVGSVLGQRAEALVLDASRFSTDPPAPLSLVSVPAIAIVLVLLALVAGLTAGPGRAAVVVLVPGSVIVAAQLLKQQVIDRPVLFELAAENSFPSGHMTVIAALAGAAIWAAPRGLTGIVSLLASGVVGLAGWQLLEYGWHRPSDMAGALALVVLGFSLASAAGAGAGRPTRPVPRIVRTLHRVTGVVLAVGGVALVVGGSALAAVAVALDRSVLLLSAAQIATVGASMISVRVIWALRG